MLGVISTVMSILTVLCVLAIPVLLIIFFIRWIMKKKKKWIGLSALFCFIGVIITALIGSQANLYSMSPEERTAYYEKIEQEEEQREAKKAAKKKEKAEKKLAEEKKKEEEKLAADKKKKDNSSKETSESKEDKTEITSSKEPVESKVETSSPKEETTEIKNEIPLVVEKEDAMITQFKDLGFTKAEAENMKEIFTTVGITKISNIKAFGDTGIDNLQAFKSDIYDSHADKGGISIHFTIDKRQLCFISLDGIATTKVDYAYINIFGNVKFKTSNSKKSVTLYDIWDENGEIIPNAIGYKAVLDYENKKITPYE